MRYKEALEKVEKMLEERGIRQFCRTACKGRCCQAHIDNCLGGSCKHPPLICAMYLCDEMKRILFGFHAGEKYQRVFCQIYQLFEDAGYDPKTIADADFNFEIPDYLMTALFAVKYESDVHIW